MKGSVAEKKNQSRTKKKGIWQGKGQSEKKRKKKGQV